MTPEGKAALMAKLAAGRAHHKKAREEAKAKGLPDPKPRKARKSKMLGSVVDPMSEKPLNESKPGIDAPVPDSKNIVASIPTDPAPSKTSHIDVPNLPEKSKLSKIVKNAEKLPVPKESGGLSTTGKPAQVNMNDLLLNEETGMMALNTMMPGQKESIKKVLSDNKKIKPLSLKPKPEPKNVTVDDVTRHVSDMKSVEAKKPFSFATIRRVLYQ